MADTIALLADIGGTNTRVALATGGAVDQGSITKYRNAEHEGLATVLNAYLEARGVAPQAAAAS